MFRFPLIRRVRPTKKSTRRSRSSTCPPKSSSRRLSISIFRLN